MNPQVFIVSPEEYSCALNVLGVEITVLATNQAAGAYEITLQEGAEGMGPPPHSQPWDESFFVLRGQVEFEAADQAATVQAGSLVHVPAGTVHAFRFGVGGAVMIEFTGAGGGATRMFTHVAQEVPPGPPDVPKLIDLLQKHRVAVAA